MWQDKSFISVIISWPINVLYWFKQEEKIHDLYLENTQLTSLLCKLKGLSSWKQLVKQEKVQEQLLQAQQVSSRMLSMQTS